VWFFILLSKSLLTGLLITGDMLTRPNQALFFWLDVNIIQKKDAGKEILGIPPVCD